MIKSFLLIIALVNAGWCQAPRYVTTIHPFYEILRIVSGDRASVEKVLPPGASSHIYEPRPSDAKNLAGAKALFYGSRELDGWILNLPASRQISFLNLLPPESLLNLEYRKRNGEMEIIGIDPHFWCDPLAVKSLLPRLVDTLSALDPTGAKQYSRNARGFAVSLDSLDAQISRILSPVQGKRVMLSHPFFQYFFKRYNINLVNVLEIIPGREPSPKDIIRFIQQARQQMVQAIFVHAQHSQRPAKLVGESTGVKIYQLDPIGGTTGRETYQELMIYNAKIILQALQ